MITAELNHNPYLLETSVRFNGQRPRINSQIEKYENQPLKSWAGSVPQIFYDEMNGYDFDLNYTGTVSDFEEVRQAFKRAGVPEDQVRLFHKNELESIDTKCREIHALLAWMQEHPNRKLDMQTFMDDHASLFEEAYPYIVIGGNQPDNQTSHISIETVGGADEVQNTVLWNTPIVFCIEDEASAFREELLKILSREDVRQNQLFFLFHPSLNEAQMVRVLMDLGIEDPQVIADFYDEKVLNYLRDYPITAYIQETIRLFTDTVGGIGAVLDSESLESVQTNASVHTEIDGHEEQIHKIKEADRFFTERDYYSAPAEYQSARKALEQQIRKWQNWKTKIVGDAEAEKAAHAFDNELRKDLANFISTAKAASEKQASEINERFHRAYGEQGLDVTYRPEHILENIVSDYDCPILTEELLMLKIIHYEDPVADLVGKFLKTASREPKRIATCYYEQWREKAAEKLIPIADWIIDADTGIMQKYYDAMAEAYHMHLLDLMAEETDCKDRAMEKLSDEERRLQEDQDWLQTIRDQLMQIERG